MILLLLFALTTLVGMISFLHIVYVIKISDHPYMNKNWFHVKIVEWVWSIPYRKWTNVCPYSWAMLGTMVALPLLAFIMGIRDLFVHIFLPWWEDIGDRYDNWCKKREKEYYEKLKNNINSSSQNNSWDDKLLKYLDKIWGDDLENDDVDTGKMARLYYYNESDPIYRMLYYNYTREELAELKRRSREKLAEYHQKLEEEERKKQEIANKSRKHITKLAKGGKLLGKGMGVIFAGFITYWVVMGCLWLAQNVDWSGFWMILAKVLVTLVVVVALASIVYNIYKFCVHLWCRYGKYCIPCERRRNAIVKYLGYILIPYKWIGDKTVLFIEILQAAADDTECPRADWE